MFANIKTWLVLVALESCSLLFIILNYSLKPLKGMDLLGHDTETSVVSLEELGKDKQVSGVTMRRKVCPVDG
jgi:hypothetical protein